MFTIYGGKTEFRQWDLNLKVVNPNMCDCEQVVFRMSNGDSDVSRAYEFEGQMVADVPNELLTRSGRMMIDLGQGQNRHMSETTYFDVAPADKPKGYVCADNRSLKKKYLETIEQTLTDAEKAQVRKNIGVGEGGGAGGASSWNDLTDKPFGVFATDTVHWDGVADGLAQANIFGMMDVVKISDAKISTADLFIDGVLREIKVVGVLPDGSRKDAYVVSAEGMFSGYDYNLIANTYDGTMENVPVGIIYTTEHSKEYEQGVWFVNMPDAGYFESLTIPGLGCFEEVKYIDQRVLPDHALLGEITLTTDNCGATETTGEVEVYGGLPKQIRDIFAKIETTQFCFCHIVESEMYISAPVAYTHKSLSNGSYNDSRILMTFNDGTGECETLFLNAFFLTTTSDEIMRRITEGVPITMRFYKA